MTISKAPSHSSKNWDPSLRWDVIVKRWQEATKKKAHHAETDEEFGC